MSSDDAKMLDVPASATTDVARDAPAAADAPPAAASAAPAHEPLAPSLEAQLDALLATLRTAASAPPLIDSLVSPPSSSVRDVWLSLVLAASDSVRMLLRADLPRRLLREEHVAAVVDVALRVIRDVAMPLFDGEARDKSGRAAAAAASASAAAPESEQWSALLLALRQILYSSVSLLMLITRFAESERLPESLSSKLLDASFLLLGANPVSPVSSDDLKCLAALQSAAASCVQQAFMSGDRAAKQAILDAVAHTYRSIHPTRRHLRSYVVHEGRMHHVKKETGAAAAAATTTTGATPAAELAAAIGSTVPLPSGDFGERQQISVQLLSALVCQLLQSITAEPMLRSNTNAEPLLDRIQREVRECDLAEAAAKVAAAEEASAAAAAASSGKKGSTKKKGRRGSKDATGDEEMKGAEIEAPIPAAPAASSADSAFSSLHSALDTPAVRAEFLTTLTAPVDQLRDFAIYFLRKLFDAIQPPAKDAATSSHALKTKDARLLLKHFVEDLLQMTFAPEFPVAEQMLLLTVNLLCRTLDGAQSSGPKLSDGFRLLCLPTLSLITVHLKLHAQIAEKQPILFRPHKELETADASMDDTDAEGNPIKKEEVFDCYCGQRCTATDDVAMLQIVGSEFLLDCDECHTWYHGECCGFDPQTQLPSEWHCEKCVIRMECDRQTKELQARREKLVARREASTAASTPSSKSKGHKKHDSGDITAARRAQAALAAFDEQLQSAGADGVARVSASVLRQLLINYLNAAVVTGNDKTFLTSRQYDLCTWLAYDRDAEVARRKTEEEKEDISIAALALEVSPQFERDLDMCQLNWDPPAAAAASSAAAAPSSSAKCILITHDVAVNMSRQLSWDRSQSVLKYHNRIIDSLCARCYDPAPGCRKAAVDSLADLIRVDPQMLNDKRIKAALQKRLEDNSIRTREAVVDLLGAHMFQSQQAMQQQLAASASNGHVAAAAAAPVAPALSFDPSSEYFNFILGRLNDVGISVRKKVVSILQKLCLQANPHPRYIELCEKLIMCVRDSEESMQSLAVMTVLQKWFDRMQPNIAQRHRGVKIEVKSEPTVKTEGQDAVSAAAAPSSAATSASSTFTPQFEQMVHHIVSVISRLSDNQPAQSGAISEGAECLADIMLLLLEQDASLNKSGSGGATVMTSLTGLRMTLGKKKRASSISHMRSVSSTPTASPSSLSAAFSGEAGGAKKKRGQSMAAFDVDADPNSIRHICEDMVAVIIKILVNSPAASAGPASASAGPTLLQLIQSLQVFCQVFPPLLLPHIQTLLPYLKLGTEDTKGSDQQVVISNLRVVSLLLDIFREVLPILAAPVSAGSLMTPQLAATATSLASNGALMLQLQMEIQSIQTKSQHSQLIAGATPVYVLVCEHLTRQPEMIATLARVYMSWLWGAQLAIVPGQRMSGNSVRSIVGLGLLIKHFDLEAFFERDNFERRQAELVAGGGTAAPRQFWAPITAAVGKLKQDAEMRNLLKFSLEKMAPLDQLKTIPIVEHVFALFKTYLKKMLGPQQAASSAQPVKAGHEFLVLQAILHLFSRRPKLIAMSKDALELCLAPTAPVPLQRSTLKILREFMQTEDRRVQKSQRLERVKGKSASAATPKKTEKSAAGKKKKRKSKGGKANDEEDEQDEAEEQPQEEEEEEFAMEDESMTPDEVAAAAAAASSGNGSGGSWVETKVEASDLMPTLVNMCEKRVYALALSPDPSVRLQALLLMGEILHQAVSNPIDAMSTIIAALTDREPMPAKQAALIVNTIVKQVPAWVRFMEQRFMEGIRLSFDMQSRLWADRLDPLHRRNLNPNPKQPAVFDRPPTEGLVQAYDVVIKKSVSSRKAFCKSFIMDLMGVRHIGIFERQAEAPLIFSSSAAGAAAASFTSPLKQLPLEPPASLNSRTVSITSAGAGSPLETIEETPPSQLPDEDAPAFVPPTFERAVTLPLAFPSPSSVRSGDASAAAAESSPLLQLPGRPASPLAWLAYLAGICTALRFEDDEPMHMISSLSSVINTRGAALQAQIQTTIVALKKMHHETVTEEEELQASQTIQLAQPIEDAAVLSQQSTQPTQDKEALLHDLHLQCESAMAISILIRLRDWLQDSYDCAGRYEEWNATANSVSASTTRVPLKLRKVLDKECLFADLPLDEQQAEEIVAATAKKSAGIQASPRKVAGQSKASKASAHARSASVPVLPLTRSCIPVICQAQFASFNTEMERHAVFLAAKPTSRRGHKRSATMGMAGEGGAGDAAAASSSSEPAQKKSRKSVARSAGGSGSSGGGRKGAKPKPKSKKKKRGRYADEDDDESEEEEEPEEESEEEEEPAHAEPAAEAAEEDEGEWEEDWDDDDAEAPKKPVPKQKKASRKSAGGQRKKRKSATVDLTIDEGEEGEEDE